MNDPVVLDAIRLRAFFDAVARDFEQTPQQALLFLVVTASFLVLLVMMARLQLPLMSAWQRYRSQRLARRVIADADLDVAQLALLDRLTEALPSLEAQRHLLVSDPYWFSRASERLVERQPALGGAVVRLRRALDLGSPQATPPMRSTRDLDSGQRLWLLAGRGGCHGIVRELDGHTLTVTATSKDAPNARTRATRLPALRTLRVGDPVMLVLNRRSGVYRFASRLVARDGATLLVAHAPSARRDQQRAHFRRYLSLPARLAPVIGDDPGERDIPTRLVDIGGGGGSVLNPGRQFATGDHVLLAIEPAPAGELRTEARVLRTSRGGRVLHLQFSRIREPDRDRIYRMIMPATPPVVAGKTARGTAHGAGRGNRARRARLRPPPAPASVPAAAPGAITAAPGDGIRPSRASA